MQQETLQEEPKSLEQSLEQSQQAPKEQQSQPRGPEDTARLAELDREENEELADTNIWKKMSDLYTKVLALTMITAARSCPSNHRISVFCRGRSGPMAITVFFFTATIITVI